MWASGVTSHGLSKPPVSRFSRPGLTLSTYASQKRRIQFGLGGLGGSPFPHWTRKHDEKRETESRRLESKPQGRANIDSLMSSAEEILKGSAVKIDRNLVPEAPSPGTMQTSIESFESMDGALGLMGSSMDDGDSVQPGVVGRAVYEVLRIDSSGKSRY